MSFQGEEEAEVCGDGASSRSACIPIQGHELLTDAAPLASGEWPSCHWFHIVTLSLCTQVLDRVCDLLTLTDALQVQIGRYALLSILYACVLSE